MGAEVAALTIHVIHRLANLRRAGEDAKFDEMVQELRKRNKADDVERVVQLAERLAGFSNDTEKR
jgi:hypothetical protein